MHILLTVLCTFPKMLTRRICLTIKSFFTWWSFPLFSWPYCLIQGWYCEENLDSSHSHLYLLDNFLLIQVLINDFEFNHELLDFLWYQHDIIWFFFNRLYFLELEVLNLSSLFWTLRSDVLKTFWMIPTAKFNNSQLLMFLSFSYGSIKLI